MCLVVFSYQKNGSFTLIGNRDEFYNRETKEAGFWEEIPGLIAGRDLKAGGTWLGIDQNGNIAVLTNFRDPKYFKEAEKSRGELLTKFFNAPDALDVFSNYLRNYADRYNGYNLIFGNPKKDIFYYSNVNNQYQKIDYGLYGLSNAFLNTSWPKVEITKNKFQKALESNISENQLLDILTDTQMAKNEDLPDTGIDKKMEKQLSSPFIQMDGYGTRCSSLVLIDKNGAALFTERSYNESPEIYKEVSFRFTI